ncbi:MAG: hypothetical protein ABH852_04205 [Methanobacteriota archaeon]
MVFHVGEDLFSTILAVSLLSVFIAALAHSYHLYSERRNAFEGFDLALDVAERLRNRVLSSRDDRPGLIELSRERLESYSKLLALQGINLRVELRSLDGELLLSNGPEPNPLGQYFSPPASASLPVAVSCDEESARPCELTVKVWRD